MKQLISVLVFALSSSGAFASLPTPTPEQAEAQALAKAKTAHGDKIGAYKLCLYQNAVADRFKTAGTPAPAACKDPGPFVPPAPGAQAAAAPASPAAPVKK